MIPYLSGTLSTHATGRGGGGPATAPVFTVAPYLTGYTGGAGLAYNTDALFANFTVTGQPTPTITYNWVASGTGITGTTQAQYCGALSGNSVYCTVRATNPSGFVSADTNSVYVQ